MSSVLVTGGAGFIGSHLVDALVVKGREVRVLDNLTPQVHPRKPAYLNPEAEYRFSDVREGDALGSALEGVELVYHLAAAVGVGQSMYQVEAYVDANTAATATLLQRLVDDRADVRRLVVASSMSIYGEGAYRCPECGPQHPAPREEDQLREHEWELRCPECNRSLEPVPTPESKPLAPTSIYAITKRDQEEMALALGRAYGLPTVALRFFNVYGPRQSLSNPYTGVCAIFQSRIQNDKPPLVFEDGHQTRDFVSVHDIVQACVLAGEQSSADYEALNVGTGKPTSVRGIATTLLDIHGKDLPLRIENEYRAGDIRHCYADITQARTLLGYEPKVDLRAGLEEFVVWSREQEAVDRVDEAHRELAQRGLVRR